MTVNHGVTRSSRVRGAKFMLNFKHLTDAAEANGVNRNGLSTYLWHLVFSIKQAVLLMVMAIVSVVHGVFPFLFDFWLMETFINMLESLKRNFPNYFKQLPQDGEVVSRGSHKP